MLLQHDLPVGQPARVRGHRGRVADVAVQVGVAGGKPHRILCRPAAGGRVEVAGTAEVQPGLGVELPRGEENRVVKERADDASRRVERGTADSRRRLSGSTSRTELRWSVNSQWTVGIDPTSGVVGS